MPETNGHPASWSSLFEALPQGVLLLNQDGRYLDANAAALRLLDIDRPSLLTRRLDEGRWDLLAADGKVLPLDETPGALALRTGKAVPRQVVGVVKTDGDVLWLEILAEPTAEGGALVTFDDITRHHLAESILAARARIAEQATSATLEEILRATLDEAERLTGSCVGFFHFMEEDQKTLTLQAWSTRTQNEFCHAEGHGMHYAVDQAGVWVDAVHARKPVIHNDYASLPHKKGMPAGHATVLRELVAPVLRGERIVALLGVGNKPFPYGNRDLQTVQRLADLAWDIAERKRSELDLRQSEADYRALFENMVQGAFRQRADGSLIDVNASALKLFGLSRDEFLGRTSVSPTWDVVGETGEPLPADDHPSMQALRTGKPVMGQVLGVANHRSGERVWLEANAIPEFHPGETAPYRVMVTLHDLTERRRLETSLQESEARWHAMVEQAGDGFELLDENGRYLQVNESSCRALGYTREELLGLTVVETDPSLALEAFRARFTALIGQPALTFETIHQRKDGTRFPVEVTASVIRMGEHPRILAQVRDISERTRSSESLRVAKELLDQTLDSLEAHVAVLDRAGNILAVNEPWRRFARENGIRDTVGTVEQVNYLDVMASSCQNASGDTADIRRGLVEVLGGSLPYFEAEYPCDGPTKPRWFRMHILPLQAAQGGAVITHENITEEKLAHLALEKAQERLEFAQTAAGAGLWEWDLVSDRFTWSPELFRLYGLDPNRDQATAETWRRILHPDDLRAVEERTETVIAERKPFANEYRVVLPNGQTRWIRAQGAFDLDTEGRPVRMAGICVDHTAQRKAEQDLADSEAKARTMLQTARDGVWLLGPDGSIRDANDAACRMLGYPREALLNLSVTDVEVQESPDGVRRHIAEIARQGWDLFESEHRRQDGSVFPVEISVTHQPDQDLLVVFVRDITERNRTQTLLQESESRLRAIIEHSTDAIGVSMDGVHVMVNPAYRRIFGYAQEEDLVGTPILELIAPESLAQVTQFVEDRAAGRPVPASYEIRGLRKDQSSFDMSVHASTYELEGQVFTLVILRDISARKQAETVLRESEARFRAMFDDSPIGIWEEDFSEVKASFDALRHQGVTDFRAHFAEHPEEVARLAGLVRVLRVNRASVLSLKAASEEELVRNLPAYFTPGSLEVFKEELCALALGQTRFRTEGPHLDALGQPLVFDISFVVQPGYESTLERVLISLVDITERKGIETALRESQSRMREALQFNEQLLAAMPIGAAAYDGRSGRCLVANQALAQYAGGSLEQVQQQRFRELPSWRESGMLAVAERVLVSGQEEHLEVQVTSTFGKQVWFSCDFSAFAGAQGPILLIMCVDISERKRADLALLRSEHQYRSLFDSMKEGFALHELITDEQGQPYDYRYLEVNPAFAAMTGIPREQWLGRRVLEILPGVEARWIREFGQVALTGLSVTFEDEVKDLGRWYRVTAYQPAPRQFAVLVTDITSRKQAEAEHLRLEQQLAKTQKMDSLGSLAGGVAHDMNNVLGAIMGLASIHQEQAPEGTRLHKSMDTILKACTRGRTLVKGLLGFARQELQEVRLVDLNDLIREEVALLEHTIPASVRIVPELAPGLGLMHGDPASLSHALMNLCVNAVDAMPGGGSLFLRTRNEGTAAVCLEVVDTGLGMTPAVLEKAMDPFFTTKDQGKGTGLGLAIVYGSVKAHHGQVELSSSPGKGTTVLMRFPTTSSLPLPGTPSQRSGPPGHPLNILVVDDDELILDSLVELLRSMGHRPTVARSGEEALLLLEQGLIAEVVLLDLNMPGLGGAGTLPRLRAAHPDLPVLIATGRADQSAMDLVARTPRTLLLPKPFSGLELNSHFRRLGLE
ncbi:MAG: PAS domain S-box protein [Holophagaceae bacterium]|uniref:histidine kinase n=1 Tax=Candidatus Geothrix skivensis TaxID=2954439 RepID=A0A9D7XKV5_9BACT|nr:PAS domain S-box protein [Candidatus Geothrix skivensis]